MQTLPNFTKLRPRTIKQAVKRNLNRFPPDFMFELPSKEEASPT
ncbi:MAG: ORF6N domain-containing protein [Cyclobacteriaceae bacterium]